MTTVLADIEVWALPLNTFLLIVLGFTNAYIARKQRQEHRDLVDVKRSIGVDRRHSDGNLHIHEDTGERRRVSDRGVIQGERRRVL